MRQRNGIQRKRLSWKIIFFMFAAGLSSGNIFTPAPAEAQYKQECRVTKPPENINIDIMTAETTEFEIFGSIEWQCSGSFPAPMKLYACMGFEPGDMNAGGHWLRGEDELNLGIPLIFNFLDQDPEHKDEIIGGRLADWGRMRKQSAEADDLVGETGAPSYRAKFKLDFKGRVSPNRIVMPAGMYSGTVMPTVYFPQDALTGETGSCTVFYDSADLGAITVNVMIHPVCSINAENINFGILSGLTEPQYAKGNIRVRCTALQAYTVTLASPSGMTMKGSNGGTLPYELFTDSKHTDKWQVGIPQDYESSIYGDELNIPVYARISPSGQRPQPGEYTDVLMITLEY